MTLMSYVKETTAGAKFVWYTSGADTTEDGQRGEHERKQYLSECIICTFLDWRIRRTRKCNKKKEQDVYAHDSVLGDFSRFPVVFAARFVCVPLASFSLAETATRELPVCVGMATSRRRPRR